MARLTITMPHDGETREECIADLESRYGVTVTIVEPFSGEGGWPLVRLDSSDPAAIEALMVGAYGWTEHDATNAIMAANDD